MDNTMPDDFQQSATTPAYWQDLNPDFRITDSPFSRCRPYEVPSRLVDQSIEQLMREGYFQTPPIVPAEQTARLAKVIQSVVAAGFPAVFCFVYDEFWELAGNLKGILEPALGESHLLSPGDMWIWHVDEHGQSSGWGPHRDLLETNVLHPDGKSKILTAWVPLTDATPLNGCMYLVPKHLDPNFPSELDERSVAIDALQYIRALPAVAGSVLAWSPLLLHWGGRHSRHAVGPRISIAFYLNDGGAEYGGGIPAKRDTFVPFWYRLGVIGAMISLFDGSPLAKDLRFRASVKSMLKPFLDKLASGGEN